MLCEYLIGHYGGARLAIPSTGNTDVLVVHDTATKVDLK
jgi:hypothetical protein